MRIIMHKSLDLSDIEVINAMMDIARPDNLHIEVYSDLIILEPAGIEDRNIEEDYKTVYYTDKK